MIYFVSFLWIIVYFIGMTECSFHARHNPTHQQLVPSQVLLQRNKNWKPLARAQLSTQLIIPSQVVTTGIFNTNANEERDPVVVSLDAKPLQSSSSTPLQPLLVSSSKRQSRRNRSKHRGGNQTTLDGSITSFKKNQPSSGGTHGISGKRNQQSGKIPNIYWGAIPMDHLRQHPLFLPLPSPSQIRHLDCLEDVRRFRQDSWQWDALHNGRCTTSQLASALGFLNPKSAECLGIPRSMQSSTAGTNAYHRLQQKPLRTLTEMNHALCNASKLDSHSVTIGPEVVWDVPSIPSVSLPFYARYQRNNTIPPDERQLLERLVGTRVLNAGSVRMMWGNTQESTAILTLLNYFSKKEPGIVMKEVGMCGAGLDWNTTKLTESQGQALLIGASPDALLYHPDGRVEVVEVKNHCPFISTIPPYARNVKTNHERFTVRSMPLNDLRARTVPPQYLPQLMMEMLSVGAECKSALLVRQTALNGAIILRLQRNDDWIEEMLFWLNRFHCDFVQHKVPPSINFFWSDEDGERYKTFLQWTKQLCAGVDVVDHVPNNLVQRAATATRSMFID